MRLTADVRLPSCRIVEIRENGVTKFASTLEDGNLIESVIIPTPGRTTLCVSSQVGCRMGCRFCVTGGMGFVRNLTVEEMVWQIHAARFTLHRPIDNLVFMGMGEPLDNFDNLMKALRVITDQRGLDIAYSHITISTAGHGDGIRKLAAQDLKKLRLAVSLNAADDGLRTELMPINRKYPLDRLKEDLRAFPLGKGGVFLVEYVLLDGVNDSPEQGDLLARYLRGLPVRVNVIPYNRGSLETFQAPSAEQVQRFCGRLAGQGIFVRLRQSRGRDMMAACGQLGSLPPRGRPGGHERMRE